MSNLPLILETCLGWADVALKDRIGLRVVRYKNKAGMYIYNIVDTHDIVILELCKEVKNPYWDNKLIKSKYSNVVDINNEIDKVLDSSNYHMLVIEHEHNNIKGY